MDSAAVISVGQKSGLPCPLDLAPVLVELSALGPPSEIRRQAPVLAARFVSLDRVLLTSVQNGELAAEALHPSADALFARLREEPVALAYPLVEGEILRRRRGQVVHVPSGGVTAHAFADRLQWMEYVVAPVLLDGRVIGFLHGDRDGATPLVGADVDALAAFALAFALAFERAALRLRLRAQHMEMRRIAEWAEARTGELGDGPVSLDNADDRDEAAPMGRPMPTHHDSLRELLTRREIEVLELMVHGQTNQEIARNLVLSAGTVKFHVKNILRKLHAANRAQATSRYLRLTLRREGGA